jgi:hypothetical protein
MGDVHSVSLLVFSTVAGLKFSVTVRDNPITKSLVKLCTIPNANQWTLIQLPNLPIFPSGNFSVNPGVVGYQFFICLAAGANYIAPAADTWQNGVFGGAPGMSNFCAQAVNSQFLVAMVQHEPGSQSTQLIDKPWTQNYDETLRYFQKSYDYGTVPGTVIANGRVGIIVPTGGLLQNPPVQFSFQKTFATIPTLKPYSDATGTANACRNQITSADFGVTSVNFNSKVISQLKLNSAAAAGAMLTFQFTADTGW